MLAHDVEHRLPAHCEDVQPEQHGPEAVLFPDVVGAGAGALLAAQRRHAGIEQVAEELPAGRCLVAGDAEPFRDPIGSGARRHGSRDAFEAGLVARREMGVGGKQSEAVRGRHEQPPPDDEVPIPVAVRGGAEIGRIRPHHQVVKVLGMDEVGIGMLAAEIGQRHGIDHAAGRRAEIALEDGFGVGAGCGMHRVEAKREPALDGRTNGLEVEQRVHQGLIIGDGVDDLDGRTAQVRRTDRIQVQVGSIDDREAFDRQGSVVDRIRDLLGGGAAIIRIVLDPEVAVGAAGVVRCRKHDAAERLARPNHAGSRRRRKQATLPHQDAREPVRRGHLDDGLDRFAVEVATVAADDQGLARDLAETVEYALHEVFDVVRRSKHRHLLAQSRSSRLLPSYRSGLDHAHSHAMSPDVRLGGNQSDYGIASNPVLSLRALGMTIAG